MLSEIVSIMIFVIRKVYRKIQKIATMYIMFSKNGMHVIYHTNHESAPKAFSTSDIVLKRMLSYVVAAVLCEAEDPLGTLPQSYAMRPVVFANFMASCFGAKVSSKSSRESMRALMNWRSFAVNEICHCALC